MQKYTSKIAEIHSKNRLNKKNNGEEVQNNTQLMILIPFPVRYAMQMCTIAWIILTN
jgi:hypothetical protein